MSGITSGTQREGLLVGLLIPSSPSWVRFGLLVGLLLLWIAVLVILYITTVRPLRESRPTATQGVALSRVPSRTNT